MKYFAEIDEKNNVIRVIVAEEIEWCQNNLSGNWIETKYDGSLRKNFGNIGYTYDATRDAFIPPKVNCHSKETLDETTCHWVCTNEEHKVVTNGNN